MAENSCGIILCNDSSEVPNIQKIKQDFEKGNDDAKREALKKVIYLLLNGEKVQQLMVPIIRYVTPCKDHGIKKLLLLYWELVDKQNTGDALLLACNALLRDLTYPNEYVRGSTLRFLCKLSDEEILQPLVDAVRTNLKHRIAYVRRNAVLASYSIVKDHPHLFPDGVELVYNQLLEESDPSCKRNMFIMLFNCAQDKAIAYLTEILDQIQNFGEMLQLIVVEVIRKAVRTKPEDRGRYLKCIFSLLSSNSAAVQFESAQTLISLSAAPTSVRAAASTYINLLVKESDNNVKLIVLDKLTELQKKHSKVLQKLTMDILRALVSPNMEIRSKTLSIALDLVTPANIGEVVMVFKKEMNRTQTDGFEDANEYRRMLVKAIHSCAVKFPDVAHDVVYVLLDFIGDDDIESAYDVISFVREVVQTYPQMRDSILGKLVSSFDQIKAGSVFRATLWILGEYSVELDQLQSTLTCIREMIGVPDFKSVVETTEDKTALAPITYSGPRVLGDGTYATSSVMTVKDNVLVSQKKGQSLRQVVIGGDFYTASVVATTLSKIFLKLVQFNELTSVEKNEIQAQLLLYLAGFLQLLRDNKGDVDKDSYERICVCFQIISQGNKAASDVLLNLSRESYALYLKQLQEQKKPELSQALEDVTQVDDLIKIRQLKPKSSNVVEAEDEEDLLNKATGQDENEDDFSKKLERIVQLTGFSDPIYAEADINVHQYDITLDIFVANQTSDTLQNLCLELATLGDLKLVERPQNYTLAPYSSKNIKAHIKVSSTETGVIFGSIVYDIAGSATHTEKTIILNEIRIDVIDYISPATTDEETFRKMWSEFAWENKVVVQTSFEDLNQYLEHIITSTNMKCLTPESSLTGDCGFLSANLYARSVFGEDALMNVSIEQSPENKKIFGSIRIRSKTQGIAVSLGKKAEMASSLA